MRDIETFTVRGNIFDVMDTIKKSHIGHSIVSVEWTSNPEDDQEVIVKLTNAPQLHLSNDEVYFVHHCMHLAFASITGEVQLGIASMRDATSALRNLGDGQFIALQQKLNEYYEFYNGGEWAGRRGNMTEADISPDKMN